MGFLVPTPHLLVCLLSLLYIVDMRLQASQQTWQELLDLKDHVVVTEAPEGVAEQ